MRPAPSPAPTGSPAPQPAHSWRGLLVDLCRHWISPPTLHRTIDAMALAGLNVLHLHLTDDQAHRIECPSLPELHAVNPDGKWLSTGDIAELIAHGRERGVRILPELDMPGHTTAWLVARPELAATAAPVRVRDNMGIASVALDPTADATFEFLARLLDDVVALFDDPYVHLGGDEVDARAWPGLDVAPTQASFTDRIVQMALDRDRTPVLWDEAWHPGLDHRCVVQVWRGHGRVRAVTRGGWSAVVSSPYYLDLSYHPRHHRVRPATDAAAWSERRAELYADPTLLQWAPLASGMEGAWELETPDAPPTPDGARLLGGEACMWTELCPEDLFELRVWPTAVVVADVLWSDDDAPLDDDVLENRLMAFEEELRTIGIDLAGQREARWLDLAGGDAGLAEALAAMGRCCEPAKWYARHAALPDGRLDQPFDRFVDILGPRAATAADDSCRAAAARVLALVGAEAPPALAQARAVAEAVLSSDLDVAAVEAVGDVLVIRAR